MLFNEENHIGAKLEVVRLEGWQRSLWLDETDVSWVNPSPNIRDLETAILYPGTVLFEATNLNEGRGTDAPLKQVGAPWMTDAPEIAKAMNARRLAGVRFEARTVDVKAGDKHGGKTIPVVRMHVTDRNAVDPVSAAALLMQEIRSRHAADFAWQRGTGLERLSGTADFRKAIEGGGIQPLLDRWKKESAAFEAATRPYRIY